MENEINLSVITDINTLKSMAYDFIVARQQADQNLANVNARLQEVLNAPKGLEHPMAPGVSAASASASEPTGDADATDETVTTTEAA